MPEYFPTVELYSPILRRWDRADFGLRRARAGAAVVTMPASWVPQCVDQHFREDR